MAARGPDFRDRYVSRAPASNADIGITIARLMQVDRERSRRPGRVLGERLRGNEGKIEPVARQYYVESKRAPEDDVLTQVRLQAVGTTVYFDASGFHWPKWRTFTISITPDWDRECRICGSPSVHAAGLHVGGC